MVATRRGSSTLRAEGPKRDTANAAAAAAAASSDEDGSASTTSRSTESFSSSASYVSASPVRVRQKRAAATPHESSPRGEGYSLGVLTRKRRLIQDVEAQLAIGITPYWEGGVDTGVDSNGEEGGRANSRGAPRRSRRGEARRRYEDVAGLVRHHQKMAVNLPPMVSTREGKLLAVEVYGGGVLKHLHEDKGPRVGHCSSGYVCGHPVPRGKEGNLWCQTPVRASLESKMACKHHLHRRGGARGPSKEQRRYMILADEFYDQQGEIYWPRVVSHLRKHEYPLERAQRRQVLALGGRALALIDATIVLHGFVQCTLFWLAACRLTRRGYRFTMVAHSSKSVFKQFLVALRATAPVRPPAQASSPFACIGDASSNNVCYYASGYDHVCRLF